MKSKSSANAETIPNGACLVKRIIACDLRGDLPIRNLTGHDITVEWVGGRLDKANMLVVGGVLVIRRSDGKGKR